MRCLLWKVRMRTEGGESPFGPDNTNMSEKCTQLCDCSVDG